MYGQLTILVAYELLRCHEYSYSVILLIKTREFFSFFSFGRLTLINSTRLLNLALNVFKNC